MIGKAAPSWNKWDLFSLILFHVGCMLLPLERGFPNITIGSLMLPSGVILIGASCIMPLAKTGMFRVPRRVNMYMIAQLGMVLSLVLGALITPVPGARLSSLRIALYYAATWIVAYQLLYCAISTYGREPVFRIACQVGIIAGIVGILEGLSHSSFGPYLVWSERYSLSWRGEDVADFDALDRLIRAGGTLGNPIVYSTMMVGVLGIAFFLDHGPLRSITIATSLLSAVFSCSRTSILMLAVVALGHAVTSRGRNRVMPFLWIVGGAAAGMLGLFLFKRGEFADLIEHWLQRLGVVDGVAAEGAHEGLDARKYLVEVAFSIIADSGPRAWIFGAGAQAGTLLSQEAFQGLLTLDNAFATVLYENGFLGMACFAAAFVGSLLPIRSMMSGSLAFGVISCIAVGISFVFYMYLTCNVPCMLFLAALHAEKSRSETTEESLTRAPEK